MFVTKPKIKQPLQLPHIDQLPRLFKYIPTMQVGLYNVGWHHVELFDTNAKYALDNPDHAIHDLERALKFQAELHLAPNDIDWRGRQLLHFDYWVHAGYVKPMVEAPWDWVDDTEQHYITMCKRDASNNYNEIGINHYISIDEHERQLAGVKGDVKKIAMSAISEYVDKGIQTGVKAALRDNEKKLSDLQSERESLEQRLRELTTLEEKAALREAKEAEKKSQRLPRSLAGYVYLVKAIFPDGLTYHKIGHTRNIRDRLETFNIKLPVYPELIHTVTADDRYALEKELHERFKDKRITGTEWFQLDPDDIAYIKAL